MAANHRGQLWGLSAAVEGLQSVGVAALFGLCSSMQPREPVAVLGLGSDSRSLSKGLMPVAKPNLREEDDGIDLQGEGVAQSITLVA